MRKKSILAILAAVIGLVVPSTLGVGTAGAVGTPSAKGAIVWTECGTTNKGQCATIDVPIDWSHPNGAQFQLAIGRLPALDPAHRIGILVTNPGGPGASGINKYITGRVIADTSDLRKYYDIVSWDPRGVARSHPVVCSTSLVAQTPATYPTTQAEYQATLAFNAALAQDCRQQTGPLFDHVDTTSTVRDVDAIRAALGESKISFFGASYGTQIGQQYAELFPGRIRTMLLDSNMDHSITKIDAFRYLQTASGDFEGAFNAFAAWCARTAQCALYGRDVSAVWDELLARATAGQLVDPETNQPLSAEELRTELFVDMARTVNWFARADRLAALDAQAPLAASRTAAPTGSGDFEAMLKAFGAWCAGTADCALQDRDLSTVWSGLVQRATAGQLVDPDTRRPVSADGLRTELALALHRSPDWSQAASKLARLRDQPPAGVSSTAASAGATDVVEDSYPAIWCEDWAWSVRDFGTLESYRKQLEFLYPHTKMTLFWSDVTGCLNWTGPLNNPQHRLVISGVPPILMVTAAQDVGTPKAWGDGAAKQVPGSRVLAYDGVGHVSYRNSDVVRAIEENYLVNGILPAPGTHCPPVYPTAPASTVSNADRVLPGATR